MNNFDWKKNIKNYVKGGLIITAAAIASTLKTTGVKPPKTSLESMDIMKLTSAIFEGVLAKSYTV